MSAQQNGHTGRRLGPGPDRFKLTPNKFSRASASAASSSSTNVGRPRLAQNSPATANSRRFAPPNRGQHAKQPETQHTRQSPKPAPATRRDLHLHRPTISPNSTRLDAREAQRATRSDTATTSRPPQRPRIRLAPSPEQARTRPTDSFEATASQHASASRPKPPRALHSLSADEFCDLAAHSTAAQIAEEYGVQVKYVYSQLSRVVRMTAADEGRTLENVKDELNERRLANGAIQGRYGVRMLPPRRQSGYTQCRGTPLPGEEVEEEEVIVGAERFRDQDESISEDGFSGIVDPGARNISSATFMEVDDPEDAAGDGLTESRPTSQDGDQSPQNEIEGPAETTTTCANVEGDSRYESMPMPDEVLCNNEAYRLWVLGHRREAVEKAEETKAYMNDFILRPGDFD